MTIKPLTINHLLPEGGLQAAGGMSPSARGQETASPAGRQQSARTYRLEELVDLPRFQEMIDSLHDAIGLPVGILDCNGRIVTLSGRQDICLSFHRRNPITAQRCLIHDQIISGGLLDSEQPASHYCPMGLVDSVVPVVVAGKHLANVVIGQFLLEEPDQERFRRQAREYGFDENAYLQALAKVPVLSQERLDRTLQFIGKIVGMLCETGLERLQNLENEQRLRTIFDSVSEAILVIDQDTGGILKVNEAMTAMFGYTSGEARLLSLEALCLGDAPYSQAEAMRYVRGVEEGRTATIECHAKRKNGSLFWCEINMRGALLIDRKIALLTVRDITGRKEAEEQLYQREEEFRALVANSPDAVVRFDRDCRRVYVNPAWERITGLSSAYVLGKTPVELSSIVSETVVAYQKKIAQVISGGRAIEFEYPFKTLAGDNGWFHMRAVPERDRNGQVVSVLAVANDITELKRMRDERFRAQKLESLGVMAGGVAHDFNNMLCGVVGYIDLALRLAEPGSKMASHLRQAKQNTNRATELVRKLVALSKDEEPVKRYIDLQRILQESLEMAVQNSPVQSRMTIADNLDVVEADEGQIFQVCSNILQNGVQAMPEGGLMTIAVSNEDAEEGEPNTPGDRRYIKISFTDQGGGISEEDQKRVFDPYFTRKSNGTGLGLASAYAIIQHHDGKIELESRVGAGSTFTVYLPASGGDENRINFSCSRCTPQSGSGMSTLENTRIRGGGRIDAPRTKKSGCFADESFRTEQRRVLPDA